MKKLTALILGMGLALGSGAMCAQILKGPSKKAEGPAAASENKKKDTATSESKKKDTATSESKKKDTATSESKKKDLAK